MPKGPPCAPQSLNHRLSQIQKSEGGPDGHLSRTLTTGTNFDP